MHIIVVGCGRVGARLATQLQPVQGASGDDHTVAVLDRDEAAFTRLPDTFAGSRVVGIGFDRDRLREAGVDRADAVVAVTGGDNSNITTARVARDEFGVERVVARIYDPRRAEIYERLGIPTVATVRWTVDRVLRHVLTETPEPDWTDPTATVELVERPVPARWAARRVGELEDATHSRAVALSRNGTTIIADSSALLQDGDVAWLAVARTNLAEMDRTLEAIETVGAGHGGHH